MGQPAVLVALLALLVGLYFYYPVSIQSLFESKSPSNFASVNNSKVVGSVDTQEQVNFNTFVLLQYIINLGTKFSTL